MKRFRSKYIIVYNINGEVDYVPCTLPEFNDFNNITRLELEELEDITIKCALENEGMLYLAEKESFPGLDDTGTLKHWTNFGIVRGVIICNNMLIADDITKYLEQKKYNPEATKAS